jgi:hypothetical protein
MSVIRFPQERCSKDFIPPEGGLCIILTLPVVRADSYEALARQMTENHREMVNNWLRMFMGDWPVIR